MKGCYPASGGSSRATTFPAGVGLDPTARLTIASMSTHQTSSASSELTELLGQLVEIDSVNPTLIPGGAGESAIARFLAGWLESAGLDVSLQEAVPGRSNVIGVARGAVVGERCS